MRADLRRVRTLLLSYRSTMYGLALVYATQGLQMPNRTRSDDDTFSTLLNTVVDIATKSAKSHVEAARAIQTLETKIDAAQTDLTSLKSEIQQVKNSIGVVDQSVTKLSGSSFPQALADAVRNPQTLLILVALVASMLGLRLTIPVGLPATSPVAVPYLAPADQLPKESP